MYRSRIGEGKPAMEKDDSRIAHEAMMDNTRTQRKEYILRGRELKGEPRDLNF